MIEDSLLDLSLSFHDLCLAGSDLLSGISGLFLLQHCNFLALLFDLLAVGTGTGADTLVLEVNAAGGDVINLDDRTTGSSLTAAGLADQAEDFALLDLKADIINSLGGTKVLAQVLYAQQSFIVLMAAH